ncbi:MAG: flagellar type III secretion system pore protein FliP [bacterium]|nr:flagellar type III secretion system pore protein FliP [bacterium]
MVFNKYYKYVFSALLIIFIILGISTNLFAQGIPIPKISIGISEATKPTEVALGLQILFIFTILALAPSIIMMVTPFVRISIVLMFMRQALATQQMPSNQILIGLAIFMTFFIMSPTISQINQKAVKPFTSGNISAEKAFENAVDPLRKFMFKNARDKDLALFLNISKLERPKSRDDVPTYILIPAFMVSEIMSGFQMGLLLFIPFIVIDMVVASVLMSMGMIMLPPIMISFPFKLMLFVMVDGWNLLIQAIVKSFH